MYVYCAIQGVLAFRCDIQMKATEQRVYLLLSGFQFFVTLRELFPAFMENSFGSERFNRYFIQTLINTLNNNHLSNLRFKINKK